MTAPTFDGSFLHHWTAEILPGRPMILPSRHYVYPAQVEEVERGALEVLVQPGEGAADRNPFMATCALGFRDPAAPTGLWAMPDPGWLCAVSGGYAYLINTAEPHRFVHLRYRPVLEILDYKADDGAESLLLFVGHRTIFAWGTDGEAWESERLSAEGITGARIAGGQLHGAGWDMIADRDTPFTLNLATGQRI